MAVRAGALLATAAMARARWRGHPLGAAPPAGRVRVSSREHPVIATLAFAAATVLKRGRRMHTQGRWLLAACLGLAGCVAQGAGALKTGDVVPDFTLTDTTGTTHTLSLYRGQVVLLDFWSATCPVSARYEERLKAIATEYAAQGVVTLGIDSNQTEDAALMARVAAERQVPFPILVDVDSRVADRLGGLTTPHVFLLDAQGRLAYQGAIDDEGLTGRHPVTRHYLQEALEAVLTGQPVATPATEPFGCSIKRSAR